MPASCAAGGSIATPCEMCHSADGDTGAPEDAADGDKPLAAYDRRAAASGVPKWLADCIESELGRPHALHLGRHTDQKFDPDH